MAHLALGNIRHNGKNYKNGDEIPGLKKEEAARLVDLGVLEESGKSSDSKPAKPLMTIDEFSALAEAEQNKRLKSIKVEAAANAEERIKQYTEWYELQVKGNDNA